MKSIQLSFFFVFCSFAVLAQGQVLNVQDIYNDKKFENIGSLTSELVEEKAYVIVQFADKLDKKAHDLLNDIGAELLEYRGGQEYVLSLPQNTQVGILKALNIKKIRSSREVVLQDEVEDFESLPEYSREGDRGLLSIQFPKNLPYNKAVSLFSMHGIEVVNGNGINNYIEIIVNEEQFYKIKKLPFVHLIESVLPEGEPEDKLGGNLHKVNLLNPMNSGDLGYSGEGISIMVRDDGEIFEHIDFTGRLDQSLNTSSNGDHGDAVAGIMGGAGNLNPDFRGMAFGSDMYGVRYNQNFIDFATTSLIQNNDVIVTNSSFSNGCNGGYTNITRTVDQQTFDQPELMHVFSAGNLGTSDCGYGAGNSWGNITGGHKIGKNVIATANLNPGGTVVSSSSRGPSADGRIKPDIAANGFDHVSTTESQDYRFFGGTSAAAPVVAGVMAMLHEAYERTYSNRATGALLKMLMLNTASDRGNYGPDFIYGWGQLNASRALDAILEERFMTGFISQGEEITVPIEVPDGVTAIKIMTYWPDPEANNTGNRKALINDIDSRLEIEGQDFFPYVLNNFPHPDSLNLPASKGIDRLNNMEQIEVENIAAGLYDLKLTGFDIPFGDAQFYVTWEYFSDEIKVTYPNGGENLGIDETEFVHWQAYGNVGSFRIELLDDNDNVLRTSSRSGSSRTAAIRIPDEFQQNARLRVSRNGVLDESDRTFVISTLPENVKVEKDMESLVLVWDTIPNATSYNIYVLGDKYMDKVNSSEGPRFVFPDEAIYNNNWVAVSANFGPEFEGKRSVAIRSDQPAEFLFTNTANDKPCIDQPVIFETTNPQNDFSYRWRFGSRATPSSADGPGPHTVTYSNAGFNSGRYFIADEFGENSVLFRMEVQEEPEINALAFTEESLGVFSFSAEVESGNEYLWEFGDGNTSMEENPIHEYQNSGEFTLKLTLTGPCGQVEKTSDINVEQVVGTEDIDLAELKIAPNPSNGAFTLQLPEVIKGLVRIELIDMTGKLLAKRQIISNGNSQSLQFDVLRTGMYLLNIRTGTQTFTKRLEIF